MINLSKIAYPEVKRVIDVGRCHDYLIGAGKGTATVRSLRTEHINTCTAGVLTNGKNISSVFIPSLDEPLKGYGDTANTDDALLFNFSDDYKRLEIFVARGYRNNQKQLFDLFLDGELDDEISTLKKRAKDSKNRG